MSCAEPRSMKNKSLLLSRLADFRAVNGRGKVKFDVNRYSLPIPSIISQLFPKTVEKQAISFLKLWGKCLKFHIGPSNLQVFLLSKLAFSIVFLCVLKLKSCRKPFQMMSWSFLKKLVSFSCFFTALAVTCFRHFLPFLVFFGFLTTTTTARHRCVKLWTFYRMIKEAFSNLKRF